MNVYNFLQWKIANDDRTCENDINFAECIGAITEEERKELLNVINDIFFGKFSRKEYEEKLRNEQGK